MSNAVGSLSATDFGLIYDLGLHKGEDAELYLKKGFRVVGVDANADLCAQVRLRLAPYINNGRLTVINKAISSEDGVVTFYRNTVLSDWGTIDPRWAIRNARLGASSTEETIETVTLGALIQEFGPAHFIKIDIEGMDLMALQALAATSERPRYISIESDKVSLASIREEFKTFAEMGYTSFKIVPQHRVVRQVPPTPALEGAYAEHTFGHGHSGLFGEEAPGKWMTAAEAIRVYKYIFLRYLLVGDDPLIENKTLRWVADKIGYENGWYDTHARR